MRVTFSHPWNLGSSSRPSVPYTAASLVGRPIVVVANLKPAKLRGIESQGMLLAAKTGNKLQLVTVDGDAEPGASVG